MDENADPSLLDYLNFGSKTATGVLGALNPSKQTVIQGGGPTNWALIGGIAAAVVGVFVLVFVVGKK